MAEVIKQIFFSLDCKTSYDTQKRERVFLKGRIMRFIKSPLLIFSMSGTEVFLTDLNDSLNSIVHKLFHIA